MLWDHLEIHDCMKNKVNANNKFRVLLMASYKSGGLLFVGKPPGPQSCGLSPCEVWSLSHLVPLVPLAFWNSSCGVDLPFSITSFIHFTLSSSCPPAVSWNVESLFYESVLFPVSLHLWDVCWSCLERWYSNLWPQPPCVIWQVLNLQGQQDLTFLPALLQASQT